jgi:hypothetical protein
MTKAKRWRKLLTYAAIAVLLLAATYFGAYLIALFSARSDLHAAIAEVDAAEPGGWQLEDLESRRATVPENRNSGNVIQDAAARLPEEYKPPKLFFELTNHRPCLVLTDETATALRDELAPLDTTRQTARRLADFPAGRFPSIPIAGDFIFQTPPHHKMVTNVAGVLFADAVLLADERKLEAAWRNGQAILFAGRSVTGEPDVSALLIRIACQVRAVDAWE